MAKAQIELDLYGHANVEGISMSVYFGDADTPACEETVYWEDVLENEVDYHCIPSGPIVVDVDSDGVGEIQCMVEKLRDLADRMEEKARERKIFLREKWSNGVPKEDCIVSYEEYLNYKLGYEKE